MYTFFAIKLKLQPCLRETKHPLAIPTYISPIRSLNRIRNIVRI